ncbi:hypothetical protein JTE90_003310 [Oedothorax gibbosus]|uniref:Uncharacterized protein n=1 Tax=Oedothorax gibbosus TaxID=931172 RepID=A0AAV6TYE1_9ARAC|nr:hypothetical protein JTE90_003310 [Oedothorax gibbosus]
MISSEEEGCFTLIWEIKKFHLLLELSKIRKRKGECFSPTWKTKNRNDGREDVWCLRAYEVDKKIKFRLYAYNKQNFLGTCTVFLVDKNGKEVTCQEYSSNQTNDGSASNVFYIDTKNVLDALTPTSKTLTVCCKMWQEKLNTEGLRICSELIEVSHLWTAENFKSYSFFSDTFIERNIRFFLTFDRKDGSRQYTLIIGAAPISKDDTLNFVVYDNSIKDGGGKIESSPLNFPLQNTCRSKICIFGKTKPDGTFQIELYFTVAIHKITDTIH